MAPAAGGHAGRRRGDDAERRRTRGHREPGRRAAHGGHGGGHGDAEDGAELAERRERAGGAADVLGRNRVDEQRHERGQHQADADPDQRQRRGELRGAVAGSASTASSVPPTVISVRPAVASARGGTTCPGGRRAGPRRPA